MPYKSIIVSCTLVALIKIMNATPAGYDWHRDYTEIDYQEYTEPEVTPEKTYYDVPIEEDKKASFFAPEEEPQPLPQQQPQPQPEPEQEPVLQLPPQPQEQLKQQKDCQPPECPICLEDTREKENVKKLSCCGCNICCECLNASIQHQKLVEEKISHPDAIKYQGFDRRRGINNTTAEEARKIRRYQNATPESEPNWKWFKINGHLYFLEKPPLKGANLWRYKREDAPKDGALYEKYWRRIRPPQCDRCGKPSMEYLAPYAINPKHEHTH